MVLTNWFNNHINWTYIVGILASGYWNIALSFYDLSQLDAVVVHSIIFLAQLALSIWLLNRKNQSMLHLTWLLIPVIGVVVLMSLINKR